MFRMFVNQVLEELAYKHNIRLGAVNPIMSMELSITGTSYANVRTGLTNYSASTSSGWRGTA